MTELHVTITGLDAVVAGLGRLARGFPDAARGVIGPLGDRYKGVLVDETPRGQGPDQGPRLFERYQTEEDYSGVRAAYRITNDTPYIPYVTKGRGAIVAPPGKVLRFQIGSQVFYRRSVGAAKANPFHLRAKQRMDGELRGLPQRLATALLGQYRGRP